jgi:hypothetical protein
MPPDNADGYSEGHIDRVHDYILAPACRQVGYTTVRAGEIVYDDPLGVLKEIIDCDMVLCDLSANNKNGLYGMAVRQALGLPVTLVKDSNSILGFSTTGLDIVQYDESLRIDTVQKEVAELGEVLRRAGDAAPVKHELLLHLGIGIPQAGQGYGSDPAGTDDLTSHEEESKHLLPIISPLPEYVGEAFTDEELSELKGNDELFHLNHGRGKVVIVKKSGQLKIAKVDFDSVARMIVLGASNLLRKIEE